MIEREKGWVETLWKLKEKVIDGSAIGMEES